MEFSSFKFSGNFGDQISIIPAMRKDWQLTGKKIILYIRKNIPANYYQGATHPVINENNEMVMMNDAIFNMLRPLLMEQDFMEDVREWNGEPVKVDFDKFNEMALNRQYSNINRLPFYVYPDLATDISNVWLNVPDSTIDLAKDKIIVTRTERYNNYLISYYFLKPFEKQLLFAGTQREHDKFCKQFNLDMEYLRVDNFLTLAQALKQCKFHLSNQTAAFQISEGLKVPRILESCSVFPNVIPMGDKAYDFYFQIGLEYYFSLLNK